MVRRCGFTLVEVLVALVIFEVGLLGVVGTLVLTSQILTRTVLLERAVGEMESVLDSLAGAPSGQDGRRSAEGGTVLWSVASDGATSVSYRGHGGWPQLELWTHLRSDAPP